MPAAAGLFISYRRDDSAGHARAIAAELARRFGPARVFIDVDDIVPGQRFADSIGQALAGASVLLVLIGPRWRGERGTQPPRLFEPDDFVRQEVATALRRGLRVVPVLLEGAAMPAADALPADLQALAALQAVPLDHARFDADLARLAAALRDTVGAPPAAAWRRRAAVLGAAVLAAGAGGWWLAARARRPAVNGPWQAELHYDWLPAPVTERFSFAGEGTALQGSAAFLGVPRGIVEGEVGAGGLRFSTRSEEMGGAVLIHRYTGRLVGGELRLTLQTEGGSSPRRPVGFTARRP